MSMYNERVFNILLESKEAHSKKVAKDECCDECDSFEDTISNTSGFSDVIVPNNLKFSEQSIAICKTTKKECGECGECANEAAYFIDGRLLDIYMSDNGIENDAQAVHRICEFYSIDPEDVYVVVECDEVNKGLIDHAKEYVDCGLLRRCHDQIRNCINAGIKVAKRS